MKKNVLLGIAVFLVLSSLTITVFRDNDLANDNEATSETIAGLNLYDGLTYVEVNAKGPNTGGGKVKGEQYRIELTVIYEVATDKIVDVLYTNTGNHTTGGRYEKLWTGENVSNFPLPNHVTGYPELTASFIGKTAMNLSQSSTSIANKGSTMIDAVTGATQTTSNFISSIKSASEEYLKGNAVKSTWNL